MSYQTAEHEMIVNSEILVSGLGPLGGGDSIDNLGKDSLQAQDSFGRWMNYVITDSPSPGSVDHQALESSIPTGYQSFTSSTMDNHLPSALDQIFNITDVSPSWASSTEETKVLFLIKFQLTVWCCCC